MLHSGARNGTSGRAGEAAVCYATGECRLEPAPVPPMTTASRAVEVLLNSVHAICTYVLR